MNLKTILKENAQSEVHRTNMGGASCCPMYSFAQTAIAKYHTMGDLNNRNLFSHLSGSLKSTIKVSAGLVSSQAPLLMATFSLASHGLSSVCVHPWCLSLRKTLLILDPYYLI